MNRKYSQITDKCVPLVVASLLLCSFFSPAPAIADSKAPANRHLQNPPSLPDLPNFGGKYLRGQEYAQTNNTQCWVLKYAFAGASTQVLNSLQQTLSSAGWHVDPKQAKAEQFTAEKRKDGVTVSIRTQPGKRPGMTVATVRYLVLKAQG